MDNSNLEKRQKNRYNKICIFWHKNIKMDLYTGFEERYDQGMN